MISRSYGESTTALVFLLSNIFCALLSPEYFFQGLRLRVNCQSTLCFVSSLKEAIAEVFSFVAMVVVDMHSFL